MANRVTLRKAGWTADWVNPATDKRRQVVVASEEAGWALIQEELQAAAVSADKQERTGIKKAPPAPTGGFTLQQSYDLSWERRFKGQEQANRRVPSNWKKIRTYFGHKTQLTSITSIWYQQWREEMQDEGMKNSGINRVTATFMSMRSDALLFGKVLDLPMLPKGLRETKIPPRFLNQEEVNLLTQFWRVRGDWQMLDIFLFRISEGCRFGEVQRLTPRDIDLAADQVTFWKTKNGNPRTVPLVGVARDIVKRRCRGLRADDPVFTYSYGQWQARFKEATNALRLPGRVVGHTTRHTMAVRAIAANVSTQLLKHFGGWKSTAALEAYAHLDTQGLKHMQKALESYQ